MYVFCTYSSMGWADASRAGSVAARSQIGPRRPKDHIRGRSRGCLTLRFSAYQVTDCSP
jgi:hypothetical protein